MGGKRSNSQSGTSVSRGLRLRVALIVVLLALKLTFVFPGQSVFLPTPLLAADLLALMASVAWAISTILGRRRTGWRRAEIMFWLVATVLLVQALPSEVFHWIQYVPQRSVFQVLLTTLKNFAWPIVVIIAVIVLRAPISSLIARVENFEGLGTSVSFAKGAESFREDAASIAEDTAGEDGLSDARRDDKVPSAAEGMTESQNEADSNSEENTPETARVNGPVTSTYSELARRALGRTADDERNSLLRKILDTWSALETQASQALSELPPDIIGNRPAPRGPSAIRIAFRTLSERGFIPRDVLDVLRRAQGLRNQLVHEGAGRFSVTSLRDLLDGTRDLSATLTAGIERFRRFSKDNLPE